MRAMVVILEVAWWIGYVHANPAPHPEPQRVIKGEAGSPTPGAKLRCWRAIEPPSGQLLRRGALRQRFEQPRQHPGHQGLWPFLDRVAQAEVKVVNFNFAPAGSQKVRGRHQDRRLTTTASNLPGPCLRGHVEGIQRVVGCVKVCNDLVGRSQCAVLYLCSSSGRATDVLVDQLVVRSGPDPADHGVGVAREVSEEVAAAPGRETTRFPHSPFVDGRGCVMQPGMRRVHAPPDQVDFR